MEAQVADLELAGTPIDACHDWSHSREFEALIANRACREIIREAADLLQYLQFCASASGPAIQPCDTYEIRQRISYIESWLGE